MGSMTIPRGDYPDKSDSEIAELLAEEYGFVAVIRYKNSASDTEYTTFAPCMSTDEIERYMQIEYDPEIIYRAQLFLIKPEFLGWGEDERGN